MEPKWGLKVDSGGKTETANRVLPPLSSTVHISVTSLASPGLLGWSMQHVGAQQKRKVGTKIRPSIRQNVTKSSMEREFPLSNLSRNANILSVVSLILH